MNVSVRKIYFNFYTHLYNYYKSHFGSNHMPVVDIVLILPGVPWGIPEIAIPKKEKHYFLQNTNIVCDPTAP